MTKTDQDALASNPTLQVEYELGRERCRDDLYGDGAVNEVSPARMRLAHDWEVAAQSILAAGYRELAARYLGRHHELRMRIGRG